MCNYGIGTSISNTTSFLAEVEQLLADATFKTLLFSTNGSVLDDRNIPWSTLQALLLCAVHSKAETIIIETHIDSITDEKLNWLANALSGQKLVIEVGLESTDSFVQTNCFLKPINIADLLQIIHQAKLRQIEVQCNVLLGAPFLSTAQQLRDVEQTIRWCLLQGVSVVVFPVNIKPFTTLWYLHHRGGYPQLSAWALVWLLNRFTMQELQKIDIAWFGNRMDGYRECTIPQPILPTGCPLCNQRLQDFFNAYMLYTQGEQRLALLTQLLKHADVLGCLCWEKLQSAVKQSDVFVEHDTVYQQQLCLINALKADFPYYF